MTRNYYQRVNRQAIHGETCSEDEHQESLVSWTRDTAVLQDEHLKRLALEFFHHIPSGGGRGKPMVVQRRGQTTVLPPAQAFRLKMAGVVPGISDLRLDFVRHAASWPALDEYRQPPSYGLLIEMKAAGRYATPEQKKYQEFMKAQRFECRVRYTWQRAAIDIIWFMRLEKIAPVWIEIAPSRVQIFNDPLALLKLEAPHLK